MELSSLLWPCGCGEMQRIGDGRTKRLNIVPAQLRVTVTVCPQSGCRRSAKGVTPAPAPASPIKGGVAHMPVGEHADHLPLHRQRQTLARAGVWLYRSTLADWVGTAAFHLGPVVDRLAEHLTVLTKLFMEFVGNSAPVAPCKPLGTPRLLLAPAGADRGW
ncbi:transposase [Paracoccus sp. Ld10]|uniref:IS66 family transposase n=1 Tax=Paracoccus sp. Ld10 TaxID=649158 RepID=UPI003867978F